MSAIKNLESGFDKKITVDKKFTVTRGPKLRKGLNAMAAENMENIRKDCPQNKAPIQD
jgi:hypothetical protein